jgi:hypothetical protein
MAAELFLASGLPRPFAYFREDTSFSTWDLPSYASHFEVIARYSAVLLGHLISTYLINILRPNWQTRKDRRH